MTVCSIDFISHAPDELRSCGLAFLQPDMSKCETLTLHVLNRTYNSDLVANENRRVPCKKCRCICIALYIHGCVNIQLHTLHRLRDVKYE